MLLRWSCLALEQLRLPAAAKAAARITAAQADPLEVLSAAGGVLWAAAARVPSRLLAVKPELLPEYLATAKSTGAMRTSIAMASRRKRRMKQHFTMVNGEMS